MNKTIHDFFDVAVEMASSLRGKEKPFISMEFQWADNNGVNAKARIVVAVTREPDKAPNPEDEESDDLEYDAENLGSVCEDVRKLFEEDDDEYEELDDDYYDRLISRIFRNHERSCRLDEDD